IAANMPRMGLLGAAAAVFDRAATLAVQATNRVRQSRAERLPHDERMRALEHIRKSYEPAFDVFFAPPDPIDPALELVRETKNHTAFDAAWPSRFEPYLPEL